MKTALGKTLKAEKQAVNKRFDKAESEFGKRYTAAATGGATDVAGRVIRDSFTFPAFDYELIDAIRNRCLKSAVSVTKSEILRAGLIALANMKTTDLLEVVNRLTKVRTGRPSPRTDDDKA